MEIEALHTISQQAPSFLTQLDALSKEIGKRQAELADSAAGESALLAAPTLKRIGSTETLHNTAMPATAAPHPQATPAATAPQATAAAASPTILPVGPVDPSSPDNARRMADFRRKLKSISAASGKLHDAAGLAHPANTVLIVYFDGLTQTFFESLVKFVSMTRNQLRRVRMAARVARIRMLAEADLQRANQQEDGGGKGGEEPETPATATTTGMAVQNPIPRDTTEDEKKAEPGNAAAKSGPDTTDENRCGKITPMANFLPEDVFMQIDHKLEAIQTGSERAAHLCLRDGACDNEIGPIQSQLRSTLELAISELQRKRAGGVNPWGGSASDAELGRLPRTCRAASMRRDVTPGKKASVGAVGQAEEPIQPNHAAAPRLAEASKAAAPVPDEDEGIAGMQQQPS